MIALKQEVQRGPVITRCGWVQSCATAGDPAHHYGLLACGHTTIGRLRSHSNRVDLQLRYSLPTFLTAGTPKVRGMKRSVFVCTRLISVQIISGGGMLPLLYIKFSVSAVVGT
jgi:hypothetical protein